MPYCTNCGTFEPILKPRELCKKCFEEIHEKQYVDEEIEAIHKKVKHNLNYPLLSYLHDLYPNRRFRSSNTGEIFRVLENLDQLNTPNQRNNPNNQTLQHNANASARPRQREEAGNSRTYRRVSPTNEQQEHREVRGNAGNQGNLYNTRRVQSQAEQVLHGERGQNQQQGLGFQTYMKSNVGLIILLIAFFMPYFYISIPLEIIALVLGILARRDEPRNWRQMVVLIGSILFIMLDLFVVVFGDMIIEMYENLENIETGESLY